MCFFNHPPPPLRTAWFAAGMGATPPQAYSLFRPNRLCPPPAAYQLFCNRQTLPPIFQPPVTALVPGFETLQACQHDATALPPAALHTGTRQQDEAGKGPACVESRGENPRWAVCEISHFFDCFLLHGARCCVADQNSGVRGRAQNQHLLSSWCLSPGGGASVTTSQGRAPHTPNVLRNRQQLRSPNRADRACRAHQTDDTNQHAARVGLRTFRGSPTSGHFHSAVRGAGGLGGHLLRWHDAFSFRNTWQEVRLAPRQPPSYRGGKPVVTVAHVRRQCCVWPRMSLLTVYG